MCIFVTAGLASLKAALLTADASGIAHICCRAAARGSVHVEWERHDPSLGIQVPHQET